MCSCYYGRCESTKRNGISFRSLLFNLEYFPKNVRHIMVSDDVAVSLDAVSFFGDAVFHAHETKEKLVWIVLNFIFVSRYRLTELCLPRSDFRRMECLDT